MRYLSLLSDQELREWLQTNNEAGFRAKQIFSWIFDQWVPSIMEMKNIPQKLRQKLDESFIYGKSKIVEEESTGDMTEKLLINLNDNECVENVIIRTEDRTTFCLSSQVGCAVQCRFCASGIDGLVRNLHAGEIIDQLLICCRKAQSRPDNIVFMGIGEPMMNIEHILKALEVISSPDRFRLSPRRITVSTSGRPDGIKKLANVAKPYNLALSLHGTDDKTRALLIPDKCRKPLAEILDACTEYRAVTGRMVTFEYTLIKDINDSEAQAEKLAKLAKSHRAKVNLIPFNSVESTDYERPDDPKIVNFLKILLERGIQATCRLKKGDNINAACGQLRRSSGKL